MENPKYNNFQKQLNEAYKEVAQAILKTIKCDSKYDYFVRTLKKCLDEQDYIDFYTELGHYFLTRINQEVDEQKLFEANKEVANQMNLEDNSKDTIDNYYERNIKQFPYEMPNNNDFYLEDRNKSL